MSEASRRAAASLDTLRGRFTQIAEPHLRCLQWMGVSEVRCPDGYTAGSREYELMSRNCFSYFSATAPSDPLSVSRDDAKWGPLAEDIPSTDGSATCRSVRPRSYHFGVSPVPRSAILPFNEPQLPEAEWRPADLAAERFYNVADSAAQSLVGLPLCRLDWYDPRTPLVSLPGYAAWLLIVFDIAAQKRPGVGLATDRERIWRRDNQVFRWSYRVSMASARRCIGNSQGSLKRKADTLKGLLDYYGDTAPDFFECSIDDIAAASALAASVLADDLRRLADEPPPPSPAAPAVVLGGPNDEPTVRGKKKSKLPAAQFNVVKAMLAAKRPLTKDELDAKSGHTDARKILKTLADSDPDWRAVIHFAGKPGGRYRIG